MRLNITLPKSLVRQVDEVAGTRKRSLFIAEAVMLKMKQAHEEALEARLAEGYRACHDEGVDISAEFDAADVEGWDDY